MNSQPVFKLNRQALIAAIISAAFPMVSHAAAGRVEFAIGNVTASGTNGQARTLVKGGEINSGDTIQTADGRTQIKFTDGGYMSLQPNTQFKVDDYAYEGKTDGSEKGFFKLVKGSLRAITGAIGHTNKTAYRINTPVATIGIRGTELTGEYNEEGDKKELKVHVSHGSVFLENGGGDLVLFQGQSGLVTDENIAPGYTDGEPIVTAEGPDGGKPQEDDDQQQQEQEQLGIFTAGEQYNNDGVPNALGSGGGDGGDATLAAIQTYTATMAEGQYDLSTLAITGTPNAGTDDNGVQYAVLPGSYLKVYFGDFFVQANIDVQQRPDFSGPITSFAPFGFITGKNFSLSGSGSGGFCYSSCSFSADGLFRGPTAQNAGIGYTINGGPGGIFNPFGPSGSVVNGTAGFHVPYIPFAGALPPG